MAEDADENAALARQGSDIVHPWGGSPLDVDERAGPRPPVTPLVAVDASADVTLVTEASVELFAPDPSEGTAHGERREHSAAVVTGVTTPAALLDTGHRDRPVAPGRKAHGLNDQTRRGLGRDDSSH